MLSFDDILKDKIRRTLAGLGIRLQKSAYLPYSYNRWIYPPTKSTQSPVIFDVGANIGQSSLWYAKEFPEAVIHAFEPFEIIHKKLTENICACPNIKTHHIALADTNTKIEVARMRDALCQTGSISNHTNTEDKETIELRTLDDFCKTSGIREIHILKTDTEGHDLNVLQGASQMLSSGSIRSILSEATILPNDDDHTQLSDLQMLLGKHGFVLKSLLDLHHDGTNGELLYFNALFVNTLIA